MKHYMLDTYNCFRTRLEDMTLIYEMLEKIPFELGLKATMPPFIQPYFNGVVPEDCGISAFVLLKGGHFTIHTFSYRECYFIDFMCEQDFDEYKLTKLIKEIYPSSKSNLYLIDRDTKFIKEEIFDEYDTSSDFGPHVFLEIKPNRKIDMDYLFNTLDKMPSKINMTPIMRPYVIKNTYEDNIIYSALTMIAESHISLHYFERENKMYFDIFSCKFFDEGFVIPEIINILGGDASQKYTLISRGSKYNYNRKTCETKIKYATQWHLP